MAIRFPVQDALALEALGADVETYCYLLRELETQEERDRIESIPTMSVRFKTLVDTLNAQKALPSRFKQFVANWNGYEGIEDNFDLNL